MSSDPQPPPAPSRTSFASPAPSTTVAGSTDREKRHSGEHTPTRPPITGLASGDRVSQYEIYAGAPPPLDYTVKTNNRERKIAVWFALLYLEAGVLPLLLFFSLRWGAHLSNTTNLAIITSLIGAVSGMKVSTRQWYLWLGKDHHTRRPIGAGRWGMDIFQVVLSMCMASFFIPLIIGSSVQVRLLSARVCS